MIINEQFKSEMIDHAKSCVPNEACGIIAGKNNMPQKIYKMKNISDTPVLCYLMDPKEQFLIMKEMRNNGLEMLAIYHSHTDSESYPSKKDVELAYYPEPLYIIVSLKDPERPVIRGYRILEGKIGEEEIG